MSPGDTGRFTLFQGTPLLIGTGASGSIYLEDVDRVVKRPNRSMLPIFTMESMAESLDSEQKVYERLGHHPSVLQFYGKLPGPDGGLVLEYAPRRCIKTYLHFRMPDLCTRFKWCVQLIDALSFIHNKGVIHGDLSPGNVLLTDALDIKLCDFGGSSLDGSPYTSMAHPPYGRSYQPDHTPHINDDLFSFGTFAYEVTAGEAPYYSVEIWQDMLSLWAAKQYPPVPDYVDTRLGDIIINCWNDKYLSATCVAEELQNIGSKLSSEPLLEHSAANRLYRRPIWRTDFGPGGPKIDRALEVDTRAGTNVEVTNS